MLKQALYLSKSRPQIHELGIKFVHRSHRRRLPSVTGSEIISQFADLLLLPVGTVYKVPCAWHGSEWLTAGACSRERSLAIPTYPVSWRDGEELLPEPAVTRLVGLVNSSSWQRVGCLVALLPQRWGWMVPTSAYAKIWQIFGKMVF